MKKRLQSLPKERMLGPAAWDKASQTEGETTSPERSGEPPSTHLLSPGPGQDSPPVSNAPGCATTSAAPLSTLLPAGHRSPQVPGRQGTFGLVAFPFQRPLYAPHS